MGKAITPAVNEPRADSTEPLRATGRLTAAGALVYVLAVRYLRLDPEVAFGAAAVLGPILTAEIGRRFVYAPATVARLLGAAGQGRR